MGAARTPAAGIWGWITPLRKQRTKRRRFASLCFLAAGISFGTALYLLITRVDRTFDGAHFPLFAALVLILVAMFVLGASAESEVAKLDAEIAELEAEAVRLLDSRG
jgi:hypothetical protein